MKKVTYPCYYVGESMIQNEADAMRKARELAESEDEPVRVFIKRGETRIRQLLLTVQPGELARAG